MAKPVGLYTSKLFKTIIKIIINPKRGNNMACNFYLHYVSC